VKDFESKISQRKLIVILFIIVLTIRLIVGLYFYKIEIWRTFADDLAREAYANTILQKGIIFHLQNYKSAESIFAPGIPVVLALNKLIFGNTWLPVFILNSLISSITCLIIYYISLRFFNSIVSYFAFIWSAFYPNYIRYIGTGGNEPWIVFLFSASFLFLIFTIQRKNIGLELILFSFLSTILFHFDERYLVYPFLFSIFLLFGNSDFSVKVKKLVLYVTLTILFSLPWIIRNYIVYDDLVLISCRTLNLTHPILSHRDELLFFDHEPQVDYLTTEQIDSIEAGLLTTFPDGRIINKDEINAIKNGNFPYEFSVLEKYISRFNCLFLPFKFKDSYRISGFTFYKSWSFKHNILSIFSYGILIFLSFIAIIILHQKKEKMVLKLFMSIIVFHSLIHVLFIPYTRDRYRHPIDFVFIILGCYALVFIFRFFSNNFNFGRIKNSLFNH